MTEMMSELHQNPFIYRSYKIFEDITPTKKFYKSGKLSDSHLWSYDNTAVQTQSETSDSDDPLLDTRFRFKSGA